MRSILIAAALLALSCPAQAQPRSMRLPGVVAPPMPSAAPPQPAPPPNDYAKPENWVCRPGRKDFCAEPLDATIVEASGALKTEKFTPDPKPAIDCFYVYPTVSLDPGANSDMTPGREENRVAYFQAARFAAACRVFAPLYRQVTLTALRARQAGAPIAGDPELAYADVLAAWKAYLARDNGGRGFVLIGHSQGATVLIQLIQNEIDGKPMQKRLVSALLIGASVDTPPGKDVGGAFQRTPLCRRDSQTGCVISYASFRDTAPPPANSLFGRAKSPGMVAACVNPAALAGGKAMLDAYLLAQGTRNGAGAPPQPWVRPEKPISTAFVKVPGLLRAECVSSAAGNYLAVHVNADPGDPRADQIAGDAPASGGGALPEWGLHLIDMHLAMGDLVRTVKAQAKAYSKAARAP